MRNITKILSAALACLLLTACSLDLVSFQYGDGQLYNKRQGLYYKAAPTSYAPVVIGDAYGYYKDMDMTLYGIKGQDPAQWLTQENNGGATTVFYNIDLTLPTIAEMAPHTVYICTGEEITYSVGTIDDQTAIDTLVDLFTNGEAVEWPLVDAVVTYDLLFLGDAYPFLYYHLTYGEFPEGTFLYDRNTKRCVAIGDTLTTWIPLLGTTEGE